jgi:ATP-dependent HslUV protease ATP-binding subunit HslU
MTEDIGARRLHTVLEEVLEEVSFDADTYNGKEFKVTSELVHEKLDMVVEDDDLSRYIL